MTTLSCRAQFQEIIHWNTDSDPYGPDHRLWRHQVSLLFTDGSGTLLTLRDDQIYLERIQARQTGCGFGTKAMGWISDIADDTQTTIMLHACPDTQDPEQIQSVFRFYRRFGFQRAGGNLMIRTP